MSRTNMVMKSIEDSKMTRGSGQCTAFLSLCVTECQVVVNPTCKTCLVDIAMKYAAAVKQRMRLLQRPLCEPKSCLWGIVRHSQNYKLIGVAVLGFMMWKLRIE
jgi:hypothetical protein